jgi:hypothetical protein
MKEDRSPFSFDGLLGDLVGLAAAAAGAWVSFGFGMQIGGPLIGTLAALNGALMGALLWSAVRDGLRRLLPPRREHA